MAQVLLGDSLLTPTSPTCRGTATLFPEKHYIPLSVDDEVLAQQLSCRAEAPTNGSRSFACVRDEFASLAGFNLADVVHVLAHYHAAFSSKG